MLLEHLIFQSRKVQTGDWRAPDTLLKVPSIYHVFTLCWQANLCALCVVLKVRKGLVYATYCHKVSGNVLMTKADHLSGTLCFICLSSYMQEWKIYFLSSKVARISFTIPTRLEMQNQDHCHWKWRKKTCLFWSFLFRN